MGELTHDPTEDGFHEIQLSAKQLVFLFMLTTAVSVAIFLCGVLVGRSVGADPAAQPPIDSSAVDPRTPSGTDASAAPTTPPVPPPPVAETDLSYHERLQQEKTKEQLKPQAEAEPKPVPPAAAPARQPEAQPPAAATPSADAQAAAGVPTAPPRRGTWVIQVQALQNRAAAGAIVKRLTAKGLSRIPPPAGRRRAVDFPCSDRALQRPG